MLRVHSAIRAKAALLYAAAHPEVRLKDVGLALGYPEDQADTVISKILRNAGMSRPRGFASPAYSPKSKAQAWKPASWSRTEALQLLKEGARQADVARQVGCSQWSISQFSTQMGMGGARQRMLRKAKQQRLIALLKEDPCATQEELAEELDSSKKHVVELLREMGLCTYGSERIQKGTVPA